MDLHHMKAAIDTMAASDLSEMEVNNEGWTLRLVRHATTGAAPASVKPLASPRPQATSSASVCDILAPVFGIVHLQAAPGQPPFVQVGEQVRAGQTVCTIEAMKVFNEVACEHAGRVVAVRVVTGTEVEAGQVLVVVEQGTHV